MSSYYEKIHDKNRDWWESTKSMIKGTSQWDY